MDEVSVLLDGNLSGSEAVKEEALSTSSKPQYHDRDIQDEAFGLEPKQQKEWMKIRQSYDSFRRVRDDIILQCLAAAKYSEFMWNSTAQFYNEYQLALSQSASSTKLVRRRSKSGPGSFHRTGGGKRAVTTTDTKELAQFRVGLLGCGTMGSALVAELLEADFLEPQMISISSRRPELLGEFQDRGCRVYYDNSKLVQESAIVFLCCLPHQIQVLAKELTNPAPEANIIQDLNNTTSFVSASNNRPRFDSVGSYTETMEITTNGLDTKIKTATAAPEDKFRSPPVFVSLLSSVSLGKLQGLLKTDFVRRTIVHTGTAEHHKAAQEERVEALSRDVCEVIRSSLNSVPHLIPLEDQIAAACQISRENMKRDLLDGNVKMYRPPPQ